jgi:hypothetical protein
MPTDFNKRNATERTGLTSGRIAVAVGIAVFISSYLFLLMEIGVVLGIAIGWLVSGALSWASIMAMNYLSRRTNAGETAPRRI